MSRACSAIISLTRRAKAVDDSPSRRYCGSMYQTSQTTAQEDMSRKRCCRKDCCREFQNASTNILLYLMATGTMQVPESGGGQVRSGLS